MFHLDSFQVFYLNQEKELKKIVSLQSNFNALVVQRIE